MSIPVLNVLLGADGRWVADETGEVVAVASLERFEPVSLEVHFADGVQPLTLFRVTSRRGYVKASEVAAPQPEDESEDEA